MKEEELIADHFDSVAKYDPAHFQWRTTSYRGNRAISESFDWLDWGGKTVLEVGCGQGYYSIPLAYRAKHVVGIDVSARSVEMARQYAKDSNVSNVEFHQMNFFDFSLDSSFDIVLSITVLMHTLDLNRAIAKLSSLLRPDGFFLLSEPNARYHTRLLTYLFPSLRQSISIPRRSFTFGELRTVLSANGFRVVRESGRIFSLLGRRKPEQLVCLGLEKAGERWPFKFLGEHVAVLAQKQ